MKKFRILLLLALTLTLLCAAASAATIPGQVSISGVYDVFGAVDALTDDSTATVWQKQADEGVDLTITLYGGNVGEIWLRSGHCYSQNYYNHFTRPEVVKVTVWYQANQYVLSSDTYRYRLQDAFRPNTVSSSWNSGYQRLLLPKAYSGVTKIELTIESSIAGYTYAEPTITDIIVAAGSHATATPRTYATATPKPYVVYVTPTPGYSGGSDGYVDYITPVPLSPTPTPTRESIIITPVTNTPLVELITPQPTRTPAPEVFIPQPTKYPTEGGIVASLLKRIATRTGPSNSFDEPGSFFSAGDQVNVISKAWDDENGMWWFQVEFMYSGEWMRAYTPANRVSLNPDYVPTETYPIKTDAREVLFDHRVYFGPGEEYKMYKVSMLYQGSRAVIRCIEGDWAQIEYKDYAIDQTRRGWVPLEVLSDYPFEW